MCLVNQDSSCGCRLFRTLALEVWYLRKVDGQTGAVTEQSMDAIVKWSAGTDEATSGRLHKQHLCKRKSFCMTAFPLLRGAGNTRLSITIIKTLYIRRDSTMRLLARVSTFYCTCLNNNQVSSEIHPLRYLRLMKPNYKLLPSQC